jgi:hypothetical protein
MSRTISELGGILQRCLLAANSSTFQTEKPFEIYDHELTNMKTNELKKGFQSNSYVLMHCFSIVC